MSRVYLVRHGQAGTRQDYDALSEHGKDQARRLGEHFLREGVRFTRVFAGGLRRQLETAAEVASRYTDFPPIEQVPGWNEFDLDHVYRQLAPVLCEEDAEFREHYEAMRSDAQADRRWTPADLKIVQAWIAGHPRFCGETWLEFRGRIAGCMPEISRAGDDENIAVFTSATPIGIWAALSLDIEDHRAMRLAGVLYNASYSVIRLRGNQPRLHMFNAVPHLEPPLRTYR